MTEEDDAGPSEDDLDPDSDAAVDWDDRPAVEQENLDPPDEDSEGSAWSRYRGESSGSADPPWNLSPIDLRPRWGTS